MSEISGLRATAPRAEPAIRPAVQRAARQLETTFAAELLKAARPKPQDGMFGGGIGAHTFDSFMDEALGEAMTRHGELGLARQIAQVLNRIQSAAVAPAGTDPTQAAAPAPGPAAVPARETP